MEILGYVATFVMGITLGLLGGGGSILTVPILVYLFALPPTVATGHSLFVVGLTALIGGIAYARKGDVNFKVGFFFAVPSVIGVNISRGLILPQIPHHVFALNGLVLTKEILIMGTFALLMLAASYSMIKSGGGKSSKAMNPKTRTALISLQGLGVGLIAGFVGAGGGFLIIPALVLLAQLPMRIAIGTSLLIIAVQSLLGFAGDLSRGAVVDWPMLGASAAIAIAGIAAGSAIAHKLEEQKLKTAFGWFVLIVGAAILIEQFCHIST
jgi:uncharacterized membrane protein YfcA